MTPASGIWRGAVIVASYLAGGVSTGYYLVRWRTGSDIRERGSGSSGAQNVGRTLGARGYVITAIGDVAKGVVITAAANRLDAGKTLGAPAAIGAVAGHIWPAHLGFHGGRGLTVAFGALLVLAPAIARRSVLVALGLLPILRSPSRAVLAATALAPLQAKVARTPASVGRAITVVAGFVLIGHRHYLWPPGRQGRSV